MVDASPFISSLMVGGIAGLTLTSTAFQRPYQLIEQYTREFEQLRPEYERMRVKARNRAMASTTTNTISRDAEGKQYLTRPKLILGLWCLRRIEYYEIIVISSFLAVELFIGLLYAGTLFFPGINGNLSTWQTAFLTVGYLALLYGIGMITKTYLHGLSDASYKFRDYYRIVTRQMLEKAKSRQNQYGAAIA